MTHNITTKKELQELLEFNGFYLSPYEDNLLLTNLYSADHQVAIFFSDHESCWGCQVSTFGSDTFGRFHLCTDDVNEFANIIIPRFNLLPIIEERS
jgi:hypothetical protein